jgi:hypothetical protein
LSLRRYSSPFTTDRKLGASLLPPVDLGPQPRYRQPGVQAGGVSVKLYDFGILIIAAIVASAVAATILTLVHH